MKYKGKSTVCRDAAQGGIQGSTPATTPPYGQHWKIICRDVVHRVPTTVMFFLLVIFLNLCQVFAQSPNYNIGDVITNPDGSKGVVFWLSPDGSGGWMCALNDVSGTFAWSTLSEAVSGFPALTVPSTNSWEAYATITADTAGYSHTKLLRDAGNASTYPAAYAVDFAHGWYLPAIGQLLKLYAQQATISAVLLANGGSEISLTNYYWSSTYSEDAKGYYLTNPFGYSSTTSKSTAYKVRPVRSFSTRAIVYDTTLSYQWSNGASTPYVNVSPSVSSSYTVTATSGFGCSNTAEVSVVVANGSSQTLYDTICAGSGGYALNGFNLTAAQTATAGDTVCTASLSEGTCSTTVTLHLHRKAPATATLNASICPGECYYLNGMELCNAGTYTQHFTAANGCDSTLTLQLSVSTPPDVNIQSTADTICRGASATLSASVSSGGTATHTAVAIGDILCTDSSIVKPSDWPVAGKTPIGIVFYVDNTDEHGWAVALKEFINVRWGPYSRPGQYTASDDVSGITNYTNARDVIGDENGLTNTDSIKKHYESSFSNCQAAYNCYYYNHSTGTTGTTPLGWYLPAAGQLRKLLDELPTINATLTHLGSAAQQFTGWWYWSSSEGSQGRAWVVDYDGNVKYGTKNTNSSYCSARAIKAF